MVALIGEGLREALNLQAIFDMGGGLEEELSAIFSYSQ